MTIPAAPACLALSSETGSSGPNQRYVSRMTALSHVPASASASAQAIAATIAPTITEMTMPHTTTAAV